MGLLIGWSLTGAFLLGEDSVVNKNLSLNILAIFKLWNAKNIPEEESLFKNI